MNFKVQRFPKGHKYFTDKVIKNSKAEAGTVGSFNSTFGQIINADTGAFICFSLERTDTLISEGTRKYKLYNSPANKCVVLLFEDEPGLNTYNRKFELHVANWAFQLKGCTAPGRIIDKNSPAILQSRHAFDEIMKAAGETGTITHETFKTKIP